MTVFKCNYYGITLDAIVIHQRKHVSYWKNVIWLPTNGFLLDPLLKSMR